MTLSTRFEDSLLLPSSVDTRDVGQVLGETVIPEVLLVLSGPTGSGKTSLAQGVASGLGIRSKVVSPTFLYLQLYDAEEDAGRISFLHADWDRVLGEPEDLTEALLDGKESRVTLVEWGEKLSPSIRAAFHVRLEISITPKESGRALRLIWESGAEKEKSMSDWREHFLYRMNELLHRRGRLRGSSEAGCQDDPRTQEGE